MFQMTKRMRVITFLHSVYVLFTFLLIPLGSLLILLNKPLAVTILGVSWCIASVAVLISLLIENREAGLEWRFRWLNYLQQKVGTAQRDTI